jgi:8-oxo-dGTP diphosphatase
MEWLLIKRGENEAHAPGAMGGVGGKVEISGADKPDIIEATARREVREEVGVDLDGVAFAYGESAYFVTDDGDPVVNVVLSARIPDGAEPYSASPEEVGAIMWLTVDEAIADPGCPPWTRRSLRRAAAMTQLGCDDFGPDGGAA